MNARFERKEKTLETLEGRIGKERKGQKEKLSRQIREEAASFPLSGKGPAHSVI